MEGNNQNQIEIIPAHSSLDSIKTEFQKKLNDILCRKLTVDNIDTFADEALDKIIELTAEVKGQYENNPNLEKRTDLMCKALEDEVFNKFELPNLQEVLESIIEVKNKIDNLKSYINKNKAQVDEVITPPQENDKNNILPGEGGGLLDKKLYPRLLTLLYLIEQDFEILKEEISIVEGNVRSDMIRRTPYVRVDIPGLERLVYICDEEGNVTYVFDTEILKEKGISVETIDLEDKGDKNELINRYPGIGIRVNKL